MLDIKHLYFRSKPNCRHSVEITENPLVAGSIITQHTVDQEVRGVYFEGIAERLHKVDEKHPAYLLYSER